MNYTIIDTSIGPIGIAASEKGVVRIKLRCAPENQFAANLESSYKVKAHSDGRDLILMQVAREIREYLDGKRVKFMAPLDMRGGDFCRKVMKAMLNIPFGKTATYGDIAKGVNKPKAARAVGRAVGANPLPLMVPCHRVVGADGSLTGFGSGVDLKAQLLQLEKKALEERG